MGHYEALGRNEGDFQGYMRSYGANQGQCNNAHEAVKDWTNAFV